jgi:hypothetical protein
LRDLKEASARGWLDDRWVRDRGRHRQRGLGERLGTRGSPPCTAISGQSAPRTPCRRLLPMRRHFEPRAHGFTNVRSVNAIQ